MLVQFKYPRCIGGKDYKAGEHEIPNALKKDWYFKALVKDGDIDIVVDAVFEEVKPTFALENLSKKEQAKLADNIESPSFPLVDESQAVEISPDDLSYAELKEYVASKNIEVADNKKATLIEAIKKHNMK
jgi:hypothetical protein